MAKYRKKPVTIEAFQPNTTRIFPQWFLNAKIAGKVAGDACRGYTIQTLEGEIFAKPSDYIIQGIKGEIYPCKPDIFNETYVLEED